MDSIEKQKEYKDQKAIEKKKAKDIIKKVKARITSGVIVANKTKKVSQGKIIKKRKNTGEKELFKKIRDIRPHYCILCKKFIKEDATRCFAHLLAKGMYPKYRLNEANIALVCSIECHHKVDSMIVGHKKEIQDKLDLGANFNYIIKTLGK